MDFFALAQVAIEPAHEIRVESGITAAVIWAGIAAVTTIIALLATIAFHAGKAHSQLSLLVPKVEALPQLILDHAGPCDTDRALTNQTLEGHETRLVGLEGS